MKAIVINAFGNSSQFNIIELDVPKCSAGHLLVHVAGTSVNPVDTKIRSGQYAEIAPQFPAILHGDVAGTVVEVGEGVTRFNVGDAIFACAGGVKGSQGALAEYMLVDEELAAIAPKSISLQEAAALPLVSITAWESLFDRGKVQQGKNILVHGGTGGVGHIAAQLARWAGLNVFTTISTPEKAAEIEALGINQIIYYKRTSVSDYVKQYTDGEGFDYVLDTVGGDNIDRSLEAVKIYGNVMTTQANSTHNLSIMQSKSATLHAVFMLLPLLRGVGREHHGNILERIAELVDKQKLKTLINPKIYKFNEIAKAHDDFTAGYGIGKIIVVNEDFR